MTTTQDLDTSPLGSRRPTDHGLRVPVGVMGTGMFVPPTVVTNAELVEDLGTSDEWIRARIGIEERRFLAPDQATSSMCIEAATQALQDAQIAAADLSAIVLASMTYDQPIPSTALIVKDAIGAHNAMPLDLGQTACAGGVYALVVAAHLLQNEHAGPVLVIGGEAMSRVTDPDDRTTRVIFGDAAGAVVLGREEPGYGLLSWDLRSELSYGVEIRAGGSSQPTDAAAVEAGDQYLKMAGKEVWSRATTDLPASLVVACERAGLRPRDVDHYVLHQANRNIVTKVMQTLGVPEERAGVNVTTLGNTGSATVFTVLHQLRSNGAVGSGDVIALGAIGAGFLWGSVCLRQR